jgi:soluble P-type ATPase
MEQPTEFKMAEIANYFVKCLTEECENKDIKIEVIADLNNPYVICGACGNQITDITAVKTPKK